MTLSLVSGYCDESIRKKNDRHPWHIAEWYTRRKEEEANCPYHPSVKAFSLSQQQQQQFPHWAHLGPFLGQSVASISFCCSHPPLSVNEKRQINNNSQRRSRLTNATGKSQIATLLMSCAATTTTTATTKGKKGKRPEKREAKEGNEEDCDGGTLCSNISELTRWLLL